jgi:hypothetical protein
MRDGNLRSIPQHVGYIKRKSFKYPTENVSQPRLLFLIDETSFNDLPDGAYTVLIHSSTSKSYSKPEYSTPQLSRSFSPSYSFVKLYLLSHHGLHTSNAWLLSPLPLYIAGVTRAFHHQNPSIHRRYNGGIAAKRVSDFLE